MSTPIHYLSEAKMIARIADEKGLECETDFRLAELYVQIAIAQELKRFNDNASPNCPVCGTELVVYCSECP